MDINPAGGGMEKEEDGQTLKKKVIYTSILPFFFLLHLLPSLVVLYTERERDPENFPGTKDGAPLYLLPC